MTTEEKIKRAFDPYFKVPVEAWKPFVDLGEVIRYKKAQIIKSNGLTEKYFYFILSGSGGILLWNKNNFICVDICFANEFFGDYMSFLTEQPSPLEVVLFEKSELFRISKFNFNTLTNTDIGNKICRFASEGLFIHKQQQQIDILSKTAKERYEAMLKKEPKMIMQTPQKHIASFGYYPTKFK
ncbi:MAG: Crp/Fnr family transcriptional regulator [Candidatus Methylacidiphilales bacterium]